MKFKVQSSKFKVILLINCFLIVAGINAEEWKTYTNTNFINDAIGDSINLYCATNGGLTVFSKTDRQFTKTYTNIDGLLTNRVNCLLYDKVGNIWVGTSRGLAIFTPTANQIKIYNRFSEISNRVINCLALAGDTILIGTENGVFAIDTKGTFSFSDDVIMIPNFPSGCSQKIFAIGVGYDFWISACPGIVKLNRNLQSYTTYIHPFGDSVKAMIFISDTLYIATEVGLARFNDVNFIPIFYFTENRVVFDLKYTDNKFYFATTGGLIQYDGSNAYFILNEDTRKIFIDDGLWLGMGGLIWFGGGLKMYHEGIWYTYQSSGLRSNNVCCVTTDAYGTIYAMHYPTQTYNFRTISIKKENENWQFLNDTLIDGYFAVADKNNNIWFGHWSLNSGLSKYDILQDKWQAKTWNGYRGVIGALDIDKYNTKWTYNQYNTIIAIDSLGNEVEFTIPGLSRPEQPGYEFAFDSQNRVWLGFSGGLLMLDCKNTLHNLNDDVYEIFPFQEITSVAIDANNQVWCASAAGILTLENNSLRIFDTTKVKRVKCDAWGNVWLLSLNALLKYNIYTKEWRSYTQDNSRIIPNIDNDEKFYRWLFIDEQYGFLLIATKEGISQFFYAISDSESLSKARIYPNPFITKEHQVITFDSLPKNATVQIYSIDGKVLAKLIVKNEYAGVRWKPINLKSGVYLAIVNSGNRSQILKFAVIR